MSKRRTHSTIDSLPAAIKAIINKMVVDNEWPDDFDGERKGTPRYEDVVEYCKRKNASVSHSAIGRYAKQLRTLSVMKQAGITAREIMSEVTDGSEASQTQKAVAEMMTALQIEYATTHQDWSPKEFRDFAGAIKDCASIAITADKYVRDQIDKKIKAADKSITDIAVKKKIPDEVLKMIKEQVYGIMT